MAWKTERPASPSAPSRPAHRRWPAALAAIARILTGLLFLTAGLPKLTAYPTWDRLFHHWHVPLPELAVYAVGTYEILGGALLALGVLPRLAAALFTIDMVGAFLFAGLTDGGSQLVVPATLAIVTALLTLRGAGAWQLYPDRRPQRR